MENREIEIEKAKDEYACAELLMEKYPLQAAGHLLSSVVHAANAVSPQRGYVPLEDLPGTMFSRSDPSQMLSLVGGLQSIGGRGDRNLDGLAAYVVRAAVITADFVADVEDHCRATTTPSP